MGLWEIMCPCGGTYFSTKAGIGQTALSGPATSSGTSGSLIEDISTVCRSNDSIGPLRRLTMTTVSHQTLFRQSAALDERLRKQA